MKQIITICLLAMMTLVNAQSYQSEIPEDYGYKVKLGQTVPDFDIVLPNGETTPIKELRGKVIMLQFTANWCPVCRKEMPHIEKDIWQKHKDNKEFALYGMDLKEDVKDINKLKDATGITYPIAMDDDGSIFSAFTVENAGVTRNVIINKDGKIVYLTRLFKQKEFDDMVKVIDQLLAK